VTAAVKPMRRRDWLAMRQTKLGGTDVAAIAGLDRYRSNLSVYNEKAGLAPAVEETPVMVAGRTLEPIVARMYAKRTGRTVYKTKVLLHPDYPFLMGTPDRKVDAEDHPETGLLEIKTHGAHAFDMVRNEGLFPGHIAQLQWYLGLGGFTWGSYAVFSREGWDLMTFDVAFDPALYAALLDLAVKFYQNHILPRVPPPLVDAPQVNVTPVGETKVIDDAVIVAALAIYAEAKKVVDEANSAFTMAKDALKDSLPAKGSFRLPTATIQYVTEPGRRSIDKAALIAHGIDPTQYERQGEPYEKFAVFLRKGAK
jgi:putative phage-type endonuclease